jgi:phosphate transport system protein
MPSDEINQEHIVRSFDEELNLVTATLVRMGGVTEAQLESAVKAIETKDLDLATSVIETDKELDKFEQEIEILVTRLFALRQPMAVDLRSVMAALRISANLERIGDYSKNIAYRCKSIIESDSSPSVEGVVRMGSLARQCLRKVLNGYQAQDYEVALEAWRQDEDIDKLYTSVFTELVNYMRENPESVTSGTQLAFVGKNIERIGDLTTNIAEEIYFMVRGERLNVSRPKADTTATIT